MYKSDHDCDCAPVEDLEHSDVRSHLEVCAFKAYTEARIGSVIVANNYPHTFSDKFCERDKAECALRPLGV